MGVMEGWAAFVWYGTTVENEGVAVHEWWIQVS